MSRILFGVNAEMYLFPDLFFNYIAYPVYGGLGGNDIWGGGGCD